MSRFIFPLLLTLCAIGLFTLYTNPTYQGANGITSLKVQMNAYDDALNKSQKLKEVRDALVSRRNALPDEQLQKLEKILPDNVDNIRLIIDINGVAAKHGLTLKNVQLGSVSDSTKTRSAVAVGASGSPVGSVELGFTVAAPYEDFLVFLNDLEHNLRIMNIEKINFSVAETALNDYQLTIRTYWLH